MATRRRATRVQRYRTSAYLSGRRVKSGARRASAPMKARSRRNYESRVNKRIDAYNKAYTRNNNSAYAGDRAMVSMRRKQKATRGAAYAVGGAAVAYGTYRGVKAVRNRRKGKKPLTAKQMRQRKNAARSRKRGRGRRR